MELLRHIFVRAHWQQDLPLVESKKDLHHGSLLLTIKTIPKIYLRPAESASIHPQRPCGTWTPGSSQNNNRFSQSPLIMHVNRITKVKGSGTILRTLHSSENGWLQDQNKEIAGRAWRRLPIKRRRCKYQYEEQLATLNTICSSQVQHWWVSGSGHTQCDGWVCSGNCGRV